MHVLYVLSEPVLCPYVCIASGKSHHAGYRSQFSARGDGDDIHCDFVIYSPGLIYNMFHWYFHVLRITTWQNQARVRPQMCSRAVNWLLFLKLQQKL